MDIQNEQGQNPSNDQNNNGAELENETPEQIEAEKFIVNFKEEDWDDPDRVAEYRKQHGKLTQTVAQKNHWRDKAKRVATQPPTNPNPGNIDPAKPGNNGGNTGNESSEIIDFRLDHPEVPKEAVREIVQYAKSRNITPEEAMAKPFIQSYLKQLKDDTAIDNASPKPSGPEKIEIPNTDWSKASPEQVQKARDVIMHNARKRR